MYLFPASSTIVNLNNSTASIKTVSSITTSNIPVAPAPLIPYKTKPLLKTATGEKQKENLNKPNRVNIPTLEQQQRQLKPKLKVKKGSSKSKLDEIDEKLLLQQVLETISTQSEEFLFNEQMWKATGKEKRLTKTCLTPKGRCSNINDTFPTVKKARDWAQEREFWLSYLPRQQRIWDYQSGETGDQFWMGSNRFGDMELLEELQIDGLTGKPISFEERCQRYQQQLDWEEKMMNIYDRAATARNSKFKGREAALTLNRYREFGKTLIHNLKQVQTETKSIEMGTTRPKRSHVSEMERLEEGYNNLKAIFLLDSDLVYNLAQQHLKGSLGHRWMGLSRDDVRQVLELLERAKRDPHFCPFPLSIMSPKSKPELCGTGGSLIKSRPTSAMCNSRSASNSALGGGRPSSSESVGSKAPSKTKLKCRGDKPLKPSQLMPLHIPGPDSSRQNILIRAYTAEMDGRPDDEDCGCDLSIFKKSSRKFNKPSKKLSPVGCLSLEELQQEDKESSDEESEGITIESFVPFYSVTRS